ncbi:MAG TPA: transglycosylase SLT domain-containing protein [Chloroflexota bacterium]|nr:transglycosylase SLT domain-containing protein [Chloroflexota bacterium]
MTDTLVAARPAGSATRRDILGALVGAASREGLDPVLVAAVVEQESDFDPLAYRAEPQIGDASRGLMQLLLGTARWMGYDGEADGLFDVETSLRYGCIYLRYLQHRYAGDVRRALAGYNAGPGNVDAKGWRCVAAYVDSVLGRMERLRGEIDGTLAAGEGGTVQRAPYRRFPLEVPYVSQLEPDGKGYNNCGPACVTMALAYNGLALGTREMMHRVAAEIRGGRWDSGTYTDFEQMKRAAERFNIPCRVLTSWAEVYGALDMAQPIVILVDNRHLEPRQYPRGPAFDAHHFIVLLGYDAVNFHAADPLSVYTRAPVDFTRASVEAAVAALGSVQAIAVDEPGPAAREQGEAREEGTDEEQEMSIIRISDADLKQYLEQLGHGVNMESAIVKRACLAYRRGETRGPAVGDEYPATAPDGRAVIRQKFTAGIAEYDPATGDVGWVELVTHPEAVTQ